MSYRITALGELEVRNLGREVVGSAVQMLLPGTGVLWRGGGEQVGVILVPIIADWRSPGDPVALDVEVSGVVGIMHVSVIC